MDTARRYTLRQVVTLGLRARHGDDEATFEWNGDHGLRADPERGITTLVTNEKRLPQRGWQALEAIPVHEPGGRMR